MTWGYVAVGVGTAAAGYFGSQKSAGGAMSGAKTMGKIIPYAHEAQDSIDPWNKYRAGYATQLNDILSGKQDWKQDPGYAFRMQEGTKAVERSGFSKGYGMSGNLGAALQQRGQDIASQEYGNIINRLTNLAGATPQNAIAGGQQFGNMVTTALTGVAQGQAAAGAAQGAGTSAALTGASYALGSYFNS